jgi:hypothetical protein
VSFAVLPNYIPAPSDPKKKVHRMIRSRSNKKEQHSSDSFIDIPTKGI